MQNTLNPEAWVDNHSDYLFNYALTRVNDKDAALDLVQDTFVSAFGAKDSFEGRSAERTWLISILKRKVIDYYRKAYRNKETQLNEDITSDSNHDSPFYQSGDKAGDWKTERQPGNWGASDANLESEEFNTVIQECIGRLNEKQAAVFTLQVIEELKSDD
ncbi:MAG: RNA polymerase sigma factor, partial [Bacteroidales bacterium]|nr:RNA polymerase sigma factor [Bacteroidales bacterium]